MIKNKILLYTISLICCLVSNLILGQTSDSFLDSIKLNKWILKLNFSKVELDNKSEIIEVGDTTFLHLRTLTYGTDTLVSEFSGYVFEAKFSMHGSYELMNFSKEGTRISLGLFVHNEPNGFQVNLDSERMEITQVLYLQKGKLELEILLANRKILGIDSKLDDGRRLKTYFMDGNLKSISIFDNDELLDSSLKITKDGRLLNFGSYYNQSINLEIKDERMLFNYRDSTYTNPIEFTNLEQTVYIQEAMLASGEIPLRKGIWFFGDGNEITTKLYELEK